MVAAFAEVEGPEEVVLDEEGEEGEGGRGVVQKVRDGLEVQQDLEKVGLHMKRLRTHPKRRFT